MTPPYTHKYTYRLSSDKHMGGGQRSGGPNSSAQVEAQGEQTKDVRKLPPPQGGGLRAELPSRLGWPTGHEGRSNGGAVKGRGKQQRTHHTQLWATPTGEARSHSLGQGQGGFDSARCEDWRLVYAPSRPSVCVCEHVWQGQRRTLFWDVGRG